MRSEKLKSATLVDKSVHLADTLPPEPLLSVSRELDQNNEEKFCENIRHIGSQRNHITARFHTN